MSYTAHCIDCFGILSDRTRLRILSALQKKSANVMDITEVVGDVTQPTVSHHLKVLDRHGFLVKEKKGREMHYRFNSSYPCKGCGVFSIPLQ